MLVCKKCHCEVPERVAQQAMYEIEATLLVHYSFIVAHRKAVMCGPLCNPCLASWQMKFESRGTDGRTTVELMPS